jgi:hypothetical protein
MVTSNNRRIVIRLQELPMRPKKLDPKEINVVFGGCQGLLQACSKHNECCSELNGYPLKCQPDAALSTTYKCFLTP